VEPIEGQFHRPQENPELALFPLISGIASVIYVGLLLGGSTVTGLFASEATGFAVLFLLYLGSAFIAAFFNAGLVYGASEAFEGRDPSLKGGLQAAWSHVGTLFVWAVISAIVGIIVRLIEQQDNIVGWIVALMFSAAWGIITYFIAPVIVFEDVGVTEMFKRSGETFKDTWGETAGASFGVGLITVLFTLVGLAIAAALFFTLGGAFGGGGFVVAIAVAVLVVLSIYLLSSALGVIARTALYVYATEGKRPPEFGNVDFERGAT